MNKAELNNILDGLRSMYGNEKFPKLTEFAMDMWYDAMKDLDFKQTKQAIANYIKVGKFPPTIADIREQYGLIVEECRSESMTLRDIFNDMCNYYPNGASDKSAESVFMSKLLMVEKSDKSRVANAIKNLVIAYVKRCEQGELELNMTLSECIQESAKGVNL